MMMSRRLWKTEKSSIVRRTESVSMIHHGVEFYLYPTVSTALIHSVKPELTE